MVHLAQLTSPVSAKILSPQPSLSRVKCQEEEVPPRTILISPSFRRRLTTTRLARDPQKAEKLSL